MTIDTEFWMLLISCCAAVVPWAFSIHAKVAVIAETVQTLPRMLEELQTTMEEHEVRLDKHEAEITSLKVSTRAGS
jgi:hypothetical protein